MNTQSSVLDLIGKTPLVELHATSIPPSLAQPNSQATASQVAGARPAKPILAKLEKMNPMGSVKDRIALAMIEDAEERGAIHPGSVIVEPTSGNTGLALAMICSVKGYHLILTMPDTMSVERRDMLMALGTVLVLTPGSEGMAGAVREAERIAERTHDAFIPSQFDNPANPRIHERTTAVEIWDDTGGAVDIVVAGIGTGGTATGIARFLQSKKPAAKVIGVEPASSPFLTEGEAG